MWRIVLSLFSAGALLSLAAGPLDELMPRPQRVIPGDGFAPAAALSKVRVEKGCPAGVPKHLAAQAYRLTIGTEGVVIAADDPRGERYARVTLAQLAKLAGGADVPTAIIEDWPAFRYRGLMHDCGRNYLSMENLKAVLDMMAAYKFNLFHWHITDYYGWRLESKKYPMLQAPWAFRRQTGKYYTQKDFREILDYAAARGITVMPEFDVPGHTLSLRRGLDITYMNERRADKVVLDLLEELCSLATPEEMPFVHLGTDEARTVYEMVQPGRVAGWARRLVDLGRRPVGWSPGIPLNCTAAVKMIWGMQHDREAAGDFSSPGASPSFDSARFYFGSEDPFRLLNVATFARPCNWEGSETNKLGPIMCSWHDDYLGEDSSALFRNEAFFPALVLYSDTFWRSRARERAEFLSVLPRPGTVELDEAVDLEERVAAQRDKVLAGFPHPFQFARQTAMRWRVAHDAGNRVENDVVGGTIALTNGLGRTVLTCWIHADTDRSLGAWIGFTSYARSGGRYCGGLPEPGCWRPRSAGSATVTLNGEIIEPPKWGRPGPLPSVVHPEEPTSNYISELPFTNEEYFFREPTPIRLRKGWNEVRLAVDAKRSTWGMPNVATFVPVEKNPDGRLREARGLRFASTRP